MAAVVNARQPQDQDPTPPEETSAGIKSDKEVKRRRCRTGNREGCGIVA